MIDFSKKRIIPVDPLHAVAKKSDQVLMSYMTNSLNFNPELLLRLSSVKKIYYKS